MNMKDMIKNYEERFDVVSRGPEYSHYSQRMKDNTSEAYQLRLAQLLEEKGVINFDKAKELIMEESELFANMNYVKAIKEFKEYCTTEGIDLAIQTKTNSKDNFEREMDAAYNANGLKTSPEEEPCKTIEIDLSKILKSQYSSRNNKMYLSIKDPKKTPLDSKDIRYTEKDLNKILYDFEDISVTEEELALPVLGTFAQAY